MRWPPPPVNKSLQDSNSKAPSWSWISQWGKEIKYQRWGRYHPQILYRAIDDLDRNGCDVDESLNNTQSLDHHHDVFQDVTKRSLTLTGHLTRVLVSHEDGRMKFEYYPWVKHVTSPDTGERLGFIALDTDYELVPLDEVYCLLCAGNTDNELLCLALRPTRRAADEYVRVGIVKARLDHPAVNPEDVSQEEVGLFLSKYLPASPFWAKDGVESTIRLV
jgi:hypothetical protein